MFQFLIGRLETCKWRYNHEQQTKFQFLIGRLETVEARATIEGTWAFQFLIGRLETGLAISGANTTSRFNSS